MKLSWQEVMTTPTAVIEHHIELMNLEAQQRPKLQAQYQPKPEDELPNL